MKQNNTSLSLVRLFGDLPVLKVRFRMNVADNAKLPPYTASAWRGLLGWEIQRLVCPFDRRPLCKECAVKEHCPYFLLIEKKTPFSGLRESPRGYIIFPASSGNMQEITLTLIGSCSRFLPVVLQAFVQGQKTGIGKENYPYELISLSEILPDGSIKEMGTDAQKHPGSDGPFPLRDWLNSQSGDTETLRLRFISPLRLRQKGKYLDRMDWNFCFSTLVRRLEALHCLFHTGQPLGKERWLEIQQHFQFNGNVKGKFRWHDLYRYSNPQKRKMPMGGLLGEAEIQSAEPELRQWFMAARLLHIGKNASMGLGKVEIF